MRNFLWILLLSLVVVSVKALCCHNFKLPVHRIFISINHCGSQKHHNFVTYQSQGSQENINKSHMREDINIIKQMLGNFIQTQTHVNADQRKFNADQRKFNADQRKFNADQMKFNADQRKFNLELKINLNNAVTSINGRIVEKDIRNILKESYNTHYATNCVVQGFDQLVSLLRGKPPPTGLISTNSPSSLKASRKLSRNEVSISPLCLYNEEVLKLVHHVQSNHADKKLLQFVLQDDYEDHFHLFTTGCASDVLMKDILINLKLKYQDSKDTRRREILDIMIDFADLNPDEQNYRLQQREAISILLFTSLFTEPTHEFDFDVIGDISMSSHELSIEIGEIKSNASLAGDAKKHLLDNMLFLEHGYRAIHDYNSNLSVWKLGILYLPSRERKNLITEVESDDISIQYINV